MVRQVARIAIVLLFTSILAIPYAKASDTVTDSVPQTLSSGNIVTADVNEDVNETESTTYPRKQTFIISAYYSPIQGQNKYVTGSYSGDIKLNGGGVHGADGSNVYPGMVAAPKGYAFGTKLEIPGVGTVAVHDRGGAIVHSGERGNSYDRLDIWMGYGDAGLKRALKWGKRTLECTNYGVNPDINENVYLEGYSESEKIVVKNTLTFDNQTDSSQKQVTQENQNMTFGKTLAYGMVNEDVSKVKVALKNLNYYDGEINTVFDSATLAAVKKFQVNEKIVSDENDYGAGYIGPKTLKVLSSKINVATAHAADNAFVPKSGLVADLKPGDKGENVRHLQEELNKLNLLGVDPTGNYGDVTEHAVFKFQQINKLAGDENSTGAGILGPKTRNTMNLIISERERINKLREEN
jgi:peptidoglycan hydrolase-like protein with peptidoglycan-binding domain/3D (Asp-Asp-Asp) domain-containing protein